MHVQARQASTLRCKAHDPEPESTKQKLAGGNRMKDIRCCATLQKVRAKVGPIVIRPNVNRLAVSALALVVLAVLQIGCGPEDYQKPIQQFQDASAVVINTTRMFLGNMNVIEQNEELDNVVFQRKPLDLAKLE